MDSTARAERFDLPASASGFYGWEVAQKPIAARISLELVDKLEHAVVESFRSLNSRGSEIGGVLLGSVQSGSPTRVTIEGYELIPCDYTRGPLYRFSEADVERLDRTVQQLSSGKGLRVVGFFRSHTRKGLGLDTEDIAFLTAHFRDPHQIALLIRPFASKASTAGIFFWENGTIHNEASYLEFPFRRSELQNGVRNEANRPSENKTTAPEPANPTAEPAPPRAPARAQIVPIASRREISMPPSPAPAEPMETKAERTSEPKVERTSEPKVERTSEPKVERASEPKAERSPERESLPRDPERPPLAELVLPPLERARRGGKLIWIIGASAAALLLSGVLIYPGFGHKAKRAAPIPGQDSSALSLRVERSAGELLLSWNRDSESIKNATGAVLSISDGDQHENVNLDLAQLRNGSIVYSPTGSDVTFQLAVNGPNAAKTQSESLRVLKTRPSPMADNPAASDKVVTAMRVSGNSVPISAPAAESLPVAPPSVTPAPAPAPIQEGKQVKAFHPESLSQRLRPARSSDLPEAPGLAASAPIASALPGMNLISGMPLPPAAPAPVIPQTKQGGQIKQAELIFRKNPEYPTVARQARVQGIVVVAATVGPDGKVKAASAISGPALLQKAAVDAVKQWMYKPTTLNGAPVESETRIEIRFSADR